MCNEIPSIARWKVAVLSAGINHGAISIMILLIVNGVNLMLSFAAACKFQSVSLGTRTLFSVFREVEKTGRSLLIYTPESILFVMETIPYITQKLI